MRGATHLGDAEASALLVAMQRAAAYVKDTQGIYCGDERGGTLLHDGEARLCQGDDAISPPEEADDLPIIAGKAEWHLAAVQPSAGRGGRTAQNGGGLSRGDAPAGRYSVGASALAVHTGLGDEYLFGVDNSGYVKQANPSYATECSRYKIRSYHILCCR